MQVCKRTADVEKVKMFKHVPLARVRSILEDHDVHTTIEILLEEERQKSDDDLPIIDLTGSIYIMYIIIDLVRF